MRILALLLSIALGFVVDYIARIISEKAKINNAIAKNKETHKLLGEARVLSDQKCLNLNEEVKLLSRQTDMLQREATQNAKKIEENLKKLNTLRKQLENFQADNANMWNLLIQAEREGRDLSTMSAYKNIKFKVTNLKSKAFGVTVSIAIILYAVWEWLRSVDALNESAKDLKDEAQNADAQCSPSTTSAQSFRTVLQSFYSPDTL